MQVLHLSVECFPVAKVGGLADVVGALPKYQRKLGIDAAVVCPWFDRKFTQEHRFDSVAHGSFYQGSEELHYQVFRETTDSLGFPLYLMHIPGKLDRPEVYCYPDEAEQWIAFQHAFLHWIKNAGIQPDLVHCHDHHVGLLPFFMQNCPEFKIFQSVKTVFTVHNGQYQGRMNWNKAIFMPAFDTWKWGLLDWDGQINPLATAIKCCDAYTTVSEGYLQELYVENTGLAALFSDESAKSYGIVNGIDSDYWNPEKDGLIPMNYSIKNVALGKKNNKERFCEQQKLNPNIPLLAYIGRFATEKGADLLAEIVVKLFSKSENKISIFILGSGDAAIQENLRQLVAPYSGRLAVFFGYDESLAHQVYAAADMLLMPSRVEPCGLNQLYALTYGTIPIVRAIGGLKDTVIDMQESNGYGYVFAEASAADAVAAVERALPTVSSTKRLSAIRKKEMGLDFSWDKSAHKYHELYNQLVKIYGT